MGIIQRQKSQLNHGDPKSQTCCQGKEVWAPRQKGDIVMGPPNPSSSPLDLSFHCVLASVLTLLHYVYTSTNCPNFVGAKSLKFPFTLKLFLVFYYYAPIGQLLNSM